MSCILEPLGERVIMKRDEPETKGNILLPEQFRKKHAATRGVCVAIGPDVEQVEIGREYIWGQHAGAWVTAEGYPTTEEQDAQFYALNEGDLIARLAQ